MVNSLVQKATRSLAKGKMGFSHAKSRWDLRKARYWQRANNICKRQIKKEIHWGILLGLFTGILALLRKAWIQVMPNILAPIWIVYHGAMLWMQNIDVCIFMMYAQAAGGLQICDLWIDPSIVGLCGTSHFGGKVMHEAMHAMHVGMQLGIWIFVGTYFCFQWEIVGEYHHQRVDGKGFGISSSKGWWKEVLFINCTKYGWALWLMIEICFRRSNNDWAFRFWFGRDRVVSDGDWIFGFSK